MIEDHDCGQHADHQSAGPGFAQPVSKQRINKIGQFSSHAGNRFHLSLDGSVYPPLM